MRAAWSLAVVVAALTMSGCVPNPPTGLEQLDDESMAPVNAGYVCGDGLMFVRASLTDGDGENLALQVEVKPLNVPFDGVGLLTGTAVPSGTVGTLALPALPIGDYHWRARGVDASGQVGDWTNFNVDPTNSGVAPAADFSVGFAPPQLLVQSADPQSEPMPAGFADANNQVSFRSRVATPYPGRSIWMQVEVKPFEVPFDARDLHDGTVTSGQSGPSDAQSGTSEVNNIQLPDGTYHWRARTMDSTGLTTPWVTFDALPDMDFVTGPPPPPHGPEELCQNGASATAGGWLWAVLVLGALVVARRR